MARKRHAAEQIITKLREAELMLSKGKSVPQAYKKTGVTEQTYYRWRKEYGGLRLYQAKRLKELEKENARLKRKFRDGSTLRGCFSRFSFAQNLLQKLVRD